MNCTTKVFSADDTTAKRSGVTLSEVLVSVVIMSIGVMLLATLLPISILRTAQATQLTQAVFLRNNAEAKIESNPALLSNTQIAAGSFGVLDPLGILLVNPPQPLGGAGGIARASGGATTLTSADQLATLPDSWKLVRADTVVVGSYNSATSTITVQTATTDLQVRNGENAGNTPPNPIYRLVLFDSSGTVAAIRTLYRTGGTPTAGTALGTYDLSWRDVDTSGAVVTPAPPPLSFTPAKVQIEFQDRRFTWMMTVRKRSASTGGVSDNSWVAELEVAAFFNRSFKAQDEISHSISSMVSGADGQPGVAGVDDDGSNGIDDFGEIGWAGSDDNRFGFDMQPGVASVDDDYDGLVDNAPNEGGWIGSDDNRTITVSLASNPFLKKGGYMLEPSQLKWYRIVNFRTNPLKTVATVLLDQDIRATQGTPVSQGIFLKGVIEVYSLGSRTGEQ